jgi:hypothetical protein
MVAMVTAGDIESAIDAVKIDWPEANEWRFHDIANDTNLGDRFPVDNWMQERIKSYNSK